MRTLFSLSDLRQTVRRLGRERGFTATVLITLALCIGANLAIFAVVDAILIRSLPFPDAERLVIVFNQYPQAGVPRSGCSQPNYYDRRDGVEAFSSVAIINGGSATVGDAGAPQRVRRDRVSPEFFETLDVPLVMGRTFTDEEMIHDQSGVVILTDGFWRSYFNADPEILGRSFRVDGYDKTVIGVLPPDFKFLSRKAQIYVPASSSLEDRQPDQRHSNNHDMVARLAPGMTVAEAQVEMDAFNVSSMADDPYAELVKDAGFGTTVRPLHEDHVQSVRSMLLLLQGGVLFLFLIGGVNLLNLLLVRASGRAKELAVRQALGASRRHVAREVLLETVLLALAGGLLGLGLGAVGVRLLSVLGTDQLPLGADVQFDFRVAAVALLVSIGVGLFLAIPIVWFNLHGRLAGVLHTESRTGTTSRAAQRLRHGFIVTQISLAFMLLVGAGLLGVSLNRTLTADPGFTTDQIATGRIRLPYSRYPETEQRLAFVERLLGDVRALPGVTTAGISTMIPFGNNGSNNVITVEGYEPPPGESLRAHYNSYAMGDYWQTLGIPLVEGRFLQDSDQHSDHRVCVVDEAFARRYWPDQSALGRRISRDPEFSEEEAMTIVGVIGSVKHGELSEKEFLGAVCAPFGQESRQSITLVLKTVIAPESLFPALRRTVLSIDPELPMHDLKTMNDRIDDSLITRRSPALLAGIFAAVALLLSSIGTYGVIAYAVAQRRREIGVRMALGARPDQIRRMFIQMGIRFLVAGSLLGLLGTWVIGRAMQSMLFEVSPFHLGTIAATTAVMGLVSLTACILPSHQAARVSPLEALNDV